MNSRFIPIEPICTHLHKPDVEYVDGELEERNVGEFDHNMIQRAALFWFYLHEKEWGIRAIQKRRTRTRPQLIAIEVLSPEDRHYRVAEKIKNYMKYGVQTIWIVDSKTREGAGIAAMVTGSARSALGLHRCICP